MRDLLTIGSISINSLLRVYAIAVFPVMMFLKIVENEKLYRYLDKLWILAIITPTILWLNISFISILNVHKYVPGFGSGILANVEPNDPVPGLEVGWWAKENTEKVWIDEFGPLPSEPVYLSMAGIKTFVMEYMEGYYGKNVFQERVEIVKRVLANCQTWDGYILDVKQVCGKEIVLKNPQVTAMRG